MKTGQMPACHSRRYHCRALYEIVHDSRARGTMPRPRSIGPARMLSAFSREPRRRGHRRGPCWLQRLPSSMVGKSHFQFLGRPATRNTSLFALARRLNRHQPFFKMLRSAVLVALFVGSAHASVSVTIKNSCSESIALYDNSDTTTMAAGASTTLTLANGYVGMFRNGASDEATRKSASLG
jgi:hypothetical protein